MPDKDTATRGASRGKSREVTKRCDGSVRERTGEEIGTAVSAVLLQTDTASTMAAGQQEWKCVKMCENAKMGRLDQAAG